MPMNVIITTLWNIIRSVLDILNYNWCEDKPLNFSYFISLLIFKLLETTASSKFLKPWNLGEQ